MKTPSLSVLCVLLLMAGAGCGGAPQLMPTPNLYIGSQADPFAEVPPELQNNKVDVLYLTDRAPEKPVPGNPHYGYKRSRSVAFGVSRVELGKDVSWKDLVAASRTSERKTDLPMQIVDTR